MQTFGWYSDQLTYSNDNLIVALYCEGPPCAEFSTASLGSLSQCPPKQLPCENTDSLLSKKSVAEKVGFVMKALPPPRDVLSIWMAIKIYIYCRPSDEGRGRKDGKVSYEMVSNVISNTQGLQNKPWQSHIII